MSQQVAEFMLRKKNLPVHQKEKFLQTHDQESVNFIMPPKRKNVFFHFIGSLKCLSPKFQTSRLPTKLDVLITKNALLF